MVRVIRRDRDALIDQDLVRRKDQHRRVQMHVGICIRVSVCLCVSVKCLSVCLSVCLCDKAIVASLAPHRQFISTMIHLCSSMAGTYSL